MEWLCYVVKQEPKENIVVVLCFEVGAQGQQSGFVVF